MTRPTVVAGNWKMHGTRSGARALARAIVKGVPSLVGREVILFPSFVHLPDILGETKGSPVQVGAQNVCDRPSGAYTGEVSAAMLADLGCSHVIIGHSERRHVYFESDDLIERKFDLLHELRNDAGVPKPILCVGETLDERKEGKTMAVLRRQLLPALSHPDAFPRALIAYEPVWAIGTGVAATPEMAQETHASIREYLRHEIGAVAQDTVLLYGGSVKASNAASLFAMPDIDGGLVGGASLQADEFLSIVKS